MMSMMSDFFKDYGYGNYYQGSAKNTSGQWYDPANYGGLKAFDPNKPNDPGSIGAAYGLASLGNRLGNFSAMPAYGGAQRAVSPRTAPGNWQTGGGQNSYDANPLSPMPTLPAWATQGTPTRWEELVATGQAPKTNTNIPVPAVARGMQRAQQYQALPYQIPEGIGSRAQTMPLIGGAQQQAPGLGMVSAQGPRVQAWQGLASPQSSFAMTLADLLRNYYA